MNPDKSHSSRQWPEHRVGETTRTARVGSSGLFEAAGLLAVAALVVAGRRDLDMMGLLLDHSTMKLRSVTKVLAKRMPKYYRIL